MEIRKSEIFYFIQMIKTTQKKKRNCMEKEY